jgi:hypothetical protein
MARNIFGVALFTVIYVVVFMAVLWIAMAAGEGNGPLATLSAVAFAILSFPLVTPFLYIDSLGSAIGDVPTVIRLAILNGLLWGCYLAWVRRKMLKRLGKTRLF